MSPEFDRGGGGNRCVSPEKHCLLNEKNANGFNKGEHVLDGNDNDTPREPEDKVFLMYEKRVSENAYKVIFSKFTRGCVNLRSKQSVERH